MRAIGPVAFTHVTVTDVTGAPSMADATVIVAGDRIAAVGKSGKVRIPKDAQVVDATGKFLIPGLWDMHAHTLTDDRQEWLFLLLIANGVTGVRELGNNLSFERIIQIRRRDDRQNFRWARNYDTQCLHGSDQYRPSAAASQNLQTARHGLYQGV